ncbi:MAG: VanW family protein, partial [Clostridioides sp.]|nr:VanW family protein [Clostridioides sp.]
INGDKIANNTYVGDVNIGGLTKTEAIQKAKENYKMDSLVLKYNGEEWIISPEKIELNYDPNKTMDNALKINRSGSYFQNLSKTIKTSFGEKNKIAISFNYSEEKLKKEMTEISKKIDKDVKDAYIEIKDSKVVVNKETEGKKLNIEKSIETIKKEIGQGKFTDNLVVDTEKPNITQADLKTVDSKLGSYYTTFSSGQVNRSSNIRVASGSINGNLVKPGENFSFNATTGKRSKANGYKSAPVIENGEMKEDYGGGVCQVSSTLYNAVLLSGLEIVDVQNHTIPSSYVAKGRDATVADSGIDFVFKNNYSTPIYIRSYVDGSQVHMEIYGSKNDVQNISISTSQIGSSAGSSKKVNDPTLPAGKEVVEKKARNSYTVVTYRSYLDASGNVIKKEKVSTSYYPKKEGVIRVGTAVVEKPAEPSTTTQSEPSTAKPENPSNDETTQTPSTTQE